MKENNNYIDHNKAAWDKQALANVQWSQPVSQELIAEAKKGNWEVYVLPTPIAKSWLGDIKGKQILCLASAGGQQAPVLAAAGAKVTVIDISQEQLNKDRQVADRDQLDLITVQGDMRDLSCFDNQTFDMIIHPISNLYVEDVNPVWNECYRVLKQGGKLISSFYNPVVFVHDRNIEDQSKGIIKPAYRIPYSDLGDLPKEELDAKKNRGEAFTFGHSLQDLIGGQLNAGFVIKGYEETFQPHPRFVIDHFIPTFIGTLAVKL